MMSMYVFNAMPHLIWLLKMGYVSLVIYLIHAFNVVLVDRSVIDVLMERVPIMSRLIVRIALTQNVSCVSIAVLTA